MVETLKREEAVPTSYPSVPFGLSAAAAALDSDMIWARIESYIAHRWSEREVVWTVQGTGWWQPDLTPATVTTTEKWSAYSWASVTLNASPLGGYELDGEVYRITADVGGGTVPAEVQEAFRRLAEYMAEAVERHGAGRYEIKLGEMTEGFDRSPKWQAQAMQLSGAADLLRKYRRAP